MLLAEGLLDRVELRRPAIRPSTVVISRPRAWTANIVQDFSGHAVEEDGARAAARRVAADVRPGQSERLADEVDEQEPRLDVGGALLAVDRHLDRVQLRRLSICDIAISLSSGAAPQPSTAVRSPRSVKMRTTLRL